MITSKNIVFHELVGLDVEVISSPNPYEIGLRGEVIRETKNMLFISPLSNKKQRAGKDNKDNTNKVYKKIAKRYRVFAFDVEGKIIKVLGDVLVGRGEERLKGKKLKMRKVLRGEMLYFADR